MKNLRGLIGDSDSAAMASNANDELDVDPSGPNPSPYNFDDWGDEGQQEDGAGGGENLSSEETNLLARITDSAFSGAMFERKAAARQIVEAFKHTYEADELIENVIVVIEKLVNDEDHSVRVEIMERIPEIARLCHEVGPQLDFVVPQHILPYIVSLLMDTFAQVRTVAQTGLLILLQHGIIVPRQVDEHVLPVILAATEPSSQDDHRAEIATFMSKLAPLLGKEITINSYLKRFCGLCYDATFQVRRVCATSMAEISTVVGTPITEKVLLPRFLTLCGDEVWGVRKGCAEVFTTVAKACSLHVRTKCLAKAFEELLEDQSVWVRMSAFQNLGLFITTYTDSIREVTMSVAETSFLNEIRKVETSKEEGLESKLETNSLAQADPPKSAPSEKSTNQPVTDVVKAFSEKDECMWMSSSPTRSVPEDEVLVEAELPLEVLADLEEDHIIPDTVLDVSFTEDNLNEVPMDCTQDNSNPARIMCGDDSSLTFEQKTSQSRSILPLLECNQCNYEQCICTGDSTKVGENGRVLERTELVPQVSVSSPMEKRIHIHVEKGAESTANYNTFQYWRFPVPEIELDIDMANGQATSVYVRAKVQDPNRNVTYASNLNLSLKKFNELSLKGEEGHRSPHVDDMISRDTSDNQNSPGAGPGDENNQDPKAVALCKTEKESKTEARTDSSDAAKEKSVSEPKAVETVPAAVHRSYNNLFNASTGVGEFSRRRNESIEEDDWGPSCYFDHQDYATSNPIFPDVNLPYIVRAHGPSGNRGRLLQTLPKIYTVTNQTVVPPMLLKHFLSMSEQQRESPLDSELPAYCVFSFPAIVITLGPENWSIVRDCFERLACKFQWKIRYTLAASLHEIARVLGPELAERDLVPFYNAMTKDLDEVRIGVLTNLSEFVKIIGHEERLKILDTLDSFLTTDNRNNWRFRLQLSNQLGQLTDMYEPEAVYKYLRPISLKLALDSISDVRRGSLIVISRQVARLNLSRSGGRGDGNLVREFLLELVETLCHCSKWVQRQSFAVLSAYLIKTLDPHQFAQDILPHLISLSTDKVPNVRLVVAQTLTSAVISLDYFADTSNPHNEIILNTIGKLRCDTDRDVRFFSAAPDLENSD